MTNARMTNDEGMTKPEGGDASSSSFVIRHSSFRPGHSSLRRRGRVLERTTFWLFRLATYFVLIAAAIIFLDIGIKGGRTVFTSKPPFINLPFLTEPPQTLYVFEFEGKKMALGDREFRQWKTAHPGIEPDASSVAYSAGGIWPCIVGTALLVIGSMVLALFGFGLFVIFFGWNVSLIAGWFTLGLMVLPAIITASEESLRAVPQGLREGSLALGASKWQTIRKNVLPYAMPGILTSSILGIARVAGETAPIMFTAAYAMRDEMPWQVTKWTDFFFQGVMALPYHIYVVSSKIPQNEYTERVQYGTAFVFLVVVMLIALASIVLRERQRRRLSW